MPEKNRNYLSYLLRIWKDSADGEWHATLQDVFSGDSYHFATLFELYVNLQELTSGNRQENNKNPKELLMSQISEKAE
ncbi:MAG: hypothetical protein CL609_17185 [Anaerolineaceae bacterium]|nr:hypothetical protein [Anaerolineaceae bacterium]